MNDFDLAQFGASAQQPARSARQNPPGLPELSYTGGAYVATLRRMLARLAHQGDLARLNPEAVDDWSIALLHVSAVVTDVLTFYQERITNEGYLSTATDRRSVLELARSIGYELKPGVAAGAYLALTVPPDDEGQPRECIVKTTAAIQSTPAEGELPQIFETQTEVKVRTEWNLLRPLVNLAAAASVASEPENALPVYLTSLRIAGYRTDIQAGDLILIADPLTEEGQPECFLLATVKDVAANPAKPYTVLTWDKGESKGELFRQPLLYVFRQRTKLYEYAAGSVYFNPEPAVSTPPAASSGQGTATAPPPKIAAWSPRTLGLPKSDVNTLVINQKEILFAGTKSDLFRSADYGVSWQRAGVDLVSHAITALAISSDGVLFAGSSTGGIYLSRDDGDNWTPMSGDNVAPDASVDQKGSKYTVSYSKTLPKAPVHELDTYTDGGNLLLYAGTDKGIFRSSDEGKTWEGPLTINADGSLLAPKADAAAATPASPAPTTPSAGAPASGNGTAAAGATIVPTADDVMPAAAVVVPAVAAGPSISSLQRILALLQKLGPVLTKLAASLKAFGIDISALLVPWIGASVSEVPVRSLALNPKGKQPAVLVGTDAGKFKLKGDTNRWLFTGAVLLLAMLIQFFSSRGAGSPLPITIDATGGTVTVPVSLLAASTPQPDASLNIQGTLQLGSMLPFTDTTYTVTLVARGDFSVSASADNVLAQGSMTGDGSLTQKGSDSPLATGVELAGMAELTIPVGSSTVTTTTASVVMPGTINISGVLGGTPGPPLQVSMSDVKFDGVLASQPAPVFPWLSDTVNQMWEWLNTTVATAQESVQSFLAALWDLVPASVKSILQPVYDFVYGQLIKPALELVNTYLVQPLLANTAAMLAKLTYAALGVWLAMALWRYLAGRVTNNKAVRIDGTVNALIIRPSGQIFAASSKGLYRSLEDQAGVALPERIRRLVLRTLLKDRPMELLTVPPNDYRALAEVGSSSLLAGTADGQLWRTEDNGSTWYSFVQDNQDVPAAQGASDGAPKSLRGLKPIRSIVVTPQGQFILGDPVAKPVQDQWFTAQLANTTQIDLKSANPVPSVDSWVVLSQDSSASPAAGQSAAAGPAPKVRTYYGPFTVASADTVTTQEFGLLGGFPRLVLSEVAGKPVNLAALPRSTADVWVDSNLVDLYDNRPIEGNKFTFDRFVPGIEPGHSLILCGKPLRVKVFPGSNTLLLQAEEKLEPYPLQAGEVLEVLASPTCGTSEQAPCQWRLRATDGTAGTILATKRQLRWQAPLDTDPFQCELVMVDTVGKCGTAPAAAGDAIDLRTCVTFKKRLAFSYDRATVTLAGNIVPVTHGRTVDRFVIGNGNGMEPNEHFTLPEQPLTYLSAATARGAEPQLQVEVNEIAWDPVPFLYGLACDGRGYIVRQESDGSTSIIFGDGKQGARLPTGTDQVAATYRIGTGKLGNVAANSINQPQTFPAAVRTATNPLAASGGSDPEEPDNARRQAPRNTRCLGRIVSLLDYEDFAQRQAGIDRVQVAEFGVGAQRLILLTIAGPGGDPQAVDDMLIGNLRHAIDQYRAVRRPRVVIQPYEQVLFNVSAMLLIAPDSVGHVNEIDSQARKCLLDAFSFAQRQFGERITEAEIVAQLANVAHVAALRAVQVYRAQAGQPGEDDLSPNYKVLSAALARQDPAAVGRLLPAQLLMINPVQEAIRLRIVAINAPDTVLNKPRVTA